MNLNRPLTSDEKTCLQQALNPNPELVVLSICLESGRNDRKNLQKQGASADFIAQFERFNVGQYEHEALREAWLMGYRHTPSKKESDAEPKPAGEAAP